MSRKRKGFRAALTSKPFPGPILDLFSRSSFAMVTWVSGLFPGSQLACNPGRHRLKKKKKKRQEND
jgi:hypothetical protein